MKIGAVGLGNRIAHVFHELSQINQEAKLISYVDPLPIGKDYAEKHNFFPKKTYVTLDEMLANEKLDLLMIGSPIHLHLEHIKIGLNAGIKIFAEKPIVVDENQSFELAKLLGEFGQDQVLVGLVLRYSQHARSVRDLIDKNFTTMIREKLKFGKIDKLFPETESIIKIFCNSVDVEISKNENYSLEFSGDFNNLNRTNLVGSLLSMLNYRPGLEESMILMVFLSRIKNFDRTIAVHFRTGGDGDWRDPEMDDVANVEKLIQRVKEISADIDGNVGVYFACDSEKLKKQVLEKYSADLDIFSNNILLAHIDRSDDKGALMGSRFAIMENFMISLCDEILTGKGAFAELSANRVFVEPWRYFKN